MKWQSNGPPRTDHAHDKFIGLLPAVPVTIRGSTILLPCSCGMDSRLVEGKPRASESFTTEELEAAGLVGYYWPDE